MREDEKIVQLEMDFINQIGKNIQTKKSMNTKARMLQKRLV